MGATFSTLRKWETASRDRSCYLSVVPLLPLAALFGALSLVCAIFMLVHAFRRSLGTGMMVLLVPFYLPVYAFSQFEHSRKNLVVATFFASSVLAAIFLGLGAHALEQVTIRPPAPPF